MSASALRVRAHAGGGVGHFVSVPWRRIAVLHLAASRALLRAAAASRAVVHCARAPRAPPARSVPARSATDVRVVYRMQEADPGLPVAFAGQVAYDGPLRRDPKTRLTYRKNVTTFERRAQRTL